MLSQCELTFDNWNQHYLVCDAAVAYLTGGGESFSVLHPLPVPTSCPFSLSIAPIPPTSGLHPPLSLLVSTPPISMDRCPVHLLWPPISRDRCLLISCGHLPDCFLLAPTLISVYGGVHSKAIGLTKLLTFLKIVFDSDGYNKGLSKERRAEQIAQYYKVSHSNPNLHDVDLSALTLCYPTVYYIPISPPWLSLVL